MFMTSKINITILTVILVLLVSACGGNSDPETPDTTAADNSIAAPSATTDVATHMTMTFRT